jgi:hypothetical protein
MNEISKLYEALSNIGPWTLEVKPRHANPFSGKNVPTMVYISCAVDSGEFCVTNFVTVLTALTAEFADLTTIHLSYNDDKHEFKITLTDDILRQEDNHD